MNNADITVHLDPTLEGLIGGYLENRRHDIMVIRAALTQDHFERLATISKVREGGMGSILSARSVMSLSRLRREPMMRPSCD